MSGSGLINSHLIAKYAGTGARSIFTLISSRSRSRSTQTTKLARSYPTLLMPFKSSKWYPVLENIQAISGGGNQISIDKKTCRSPTTVAAEEVKKITRSPSPVLRNSFRNTKANQINRLVILASAFYSFMVAQRSKSMLSYKEGSQAVHWSTMVQSSEKTRPEKRGTTVTHHRRKKNRIFRIGAHPPAGLLRLSAGANQIGSRGD